MPSRVRAIHSARKHRHGRPITGEYCPVGGTVDPVRGTGNYYAVVLGKVRGQHRGDVLSVAGRGASAADRDEIVCRPRQDARFAIDPQRLRRVILQRGERRRPVIIAGNEDSDTTGIRAIQRVARRRQVGTGIELRAPHLGGRFIKTRRNGVSVEKPDGFDSAETTQQRACSRIAWLRERRQEDACRAFVFRQAGDRVHTLCSLRREQGALGSQQRAPRQHAVQRSEHKRGVPGSAVRAVDVGRRRDDETDQDSADRSSRRRTLRRS